MSSAIRKVETSSFMVPPTQDLTSSKPIHGALDRITQIQKHLSPNLAHSFTISDDPSTQITINPTSGKITERAVQFPKELQPRFEKVVGINCKDPKDATLFFFSDTHDEPLGKLFLEVIRKYGKPGDFVLLESFESLQPLRAYFESIRKDRIELEEMIGKIGKSPQGKILSPNERDNRKMEQEILTKLKNEDTLENMCLILVQEGYNLLGWDHEKARQESIQITSKQIDLENKYCQLLNEAIRPTLLNETLTLEDIAARKHWKVLSELIADPNKHKDLVGYTHFLGSVYSLVIGNLTGSVLPPHCQELPKLLGANPTGVEIAKSNYKLDKADEMNRYLRDQSLDKTTQILEKKYPDKNIFVIAGEWHLTKHITEIDDIQRKETNILENFSESKCVLAFPKIGFNLEKVQPYPQVLSKL